MPTTKETTQKKSAAFSDYEREAMKNRAKELAAEARAGKEKEAGLAMLLEAIAGLSEPDQSMAKRIHTIIIEAAPDLWPKTWYGMPAYAKDDKIVCFFQGRYKFKTRYSTLGFNDPAKLDDGDMWATAFALKNLTAAEEKKIAELVKKAVS